MKKNKEKRKPLPGDWMAGDNVDEEAAAAHSELARALIQSQWTDSERRRREVCPVERVEIKVIHPLDFTILTKDVD